MLQKVLLVLSLLCFNICYAIDIKAIKTNESFEEVAHIDKLEQIKINTVPRTSATPKNLRTQYMMSFQGRDNNNTMVWWSNTLTDYDTKITSADLIDNDYYIYDNTGKSYKTGEHVDLTPIQESINNIVSDMSEMSTTIEDNTQNIQVNKGNIEQNRQSIIQNSYDIQRLNSRVDRIDQRIDKLQEDMNAGLATVTALTSLHPNPRSNAPVELSLGAGVYRDQCAGAAGLFVHPTENIMLQGGFAYGNRDNYAGFAGVTIGLPWFKK